jgi:hypothetical protein
MMARVDLDMMEYVEKEEAARAGSRGEMSDIWHRSSEAPQQTTTREAKRSGRESPANQKGGKSGGRDHERRAPWKHARPHPH